MYADDPRRSQRGMTLIEVLVAMLVLGVSVATFLALISQQTLQTGALEDRVLARIAADNVMVEALIAEETNSRDPQGVTTVGGTEFRYAVSRDPIDEFPGVERLTVVISTVGEGERVVAELQTLLPPS